jgi:ribosomal protein L24E
MNARDCSWCGAAFTCRTGGGKAQRFCSPKCRRAMDRAARAWVREEMARGQLTVAQLQRARCPEPDPEATWPGGWIAGPGGPLPVLTNRGNGYAATSVVVTPVRRQIF